MASQEQEQQYSQTLENIIRQYETMGALMPQQQAALEQVNAGGLKAQLGLKAAGKSAVELGKVFTTAMGEMYQGKQGFTAFNSSIDQAVTFLGVLSAGLLLINPLLGIAAAGITAVSAAGAKYVKATTEQSDKLYETFQQVSRYGAAASDGLQGLYNDVQKLGGGIQNLGEFANLVAENAEGFAQFSGTVFRGRQQFANLSKEMQPFRAALMNAGMTQKEINEATAGYLRLQSRIGATQNQTTEELAASTRRYLIEQDALTKITGLNRKAQEDNRNYLINQQIFQAKLLELRRKGLGDQAEKLVSAFNLLGGQSNEVGRGFAATLSGNLLDRDAERLYRATNGESQRAAEALAAGLISPAEAADRVAQALKQNIDTFGETQGKFQNYNEIFGNLAQQTEIVTRLLTGGFTAATAAAQQMGEKMGITGDKALDAEIQRQTDTRLAQQRAMQNMQDFVRLGMEPATRALGFFGRVIERFTRLLPGSGKFAKDYETEKKAREDLVKKEEETTEKIQAVTEARKKLDAAKTAEEKAVATREFETAKDAARNAMMERDLLRQQIESGNFRKPAEPPPPGYDYDQAATDMQGTMPGEIGQRPAAPARPVAAPAAAPAAPARMGQFNRMPGASTAGGVAAPARPATAPAAAPTAAPAAPATAAVPSGPRPDYSAEGKATGGGQTEPSRPTPASGQQGSPRKKTEGVVFHHTGGRGLNTAVATLKSRGLAYHYMLDRDGTVVPFLNAGAVAYHAGKTDKNPKFGNWNTLGVAAVAKDNTDVTKEQMAAAVNLTRELAGNFGFSTQNVFGHGGVSSAKMADEGKALVDAVKGGLAVSQANMPQARDGGVFDGPMSGYRAMLHGNEAVIPLKNGSVPVTMPRDFTANMIKVTQLVEQIRGNTVVESGKNANLANKIASSVIGSEGSGSEIMTAFRQMMDEMHSQSAENRRLMESVVRAQENTVSISQKILRTAA